MEETNEKVKGKEGTTTEGGKKRGPGASTKYTVAKREIVRDGKPGSGKYKGSDKLAMKKGLTEKQKAFVDEYLQSHNASAAYRAAKGTLDTPEEWLPSDRSNGHIMRNLDKVKDYLLAKISSDAELCLNIQMDMIQNEDIPAAVRMDGIKDRLNRLGVGKQKEDNAGFTGIGEVTITIKHKAPEVIDMDKDVEILDEETEDADNKTD